MSQPTFGSAPKKMSKNKKIALAGVGVAAGVGIIWWYRKRQSSASSTDTGSTSDPNAIDPNTGLPYSQEYGGGGPFGGYGGGGPYPFQPTPSNATWAQSAESYLTQQGYDPVTVATALGLYLIGKPLTQNEYDIVTAAIAFEGYPPDGAPTPILQGGGGGGGTNVNVPHVVGLRRVTAEAILRGKGLKVHVTESGDNTGRFKKMHLTWIVTSQNPNSGKRVKVGTTVDITVSPSPIRHGRA